MRKLTSVVVCEQWTEGGTVQDQLINYVNTRNETDNGTLELGLGSSVDQITSYKRLEHKQEQNNKTNMSE